MFDNVRNKILTVAIQFQYMPESNATYVYVYAKRRDEILD